MAGRGAASRQRGIALATALILLIVVTLVGMAAVRGTIMQQKISNNYFDRQLAFQTTEATLREAENAVQAAAAGAGSYRDCSTSANKCVADPFTDSTVAVANAKFKPDSKMTGTPQYVVEYMGNFKIPPPKVSPLSGCTGYAPCGVTYTADFYRITARNSNGADGRATVTLQTMYRR